MSIIPKRHNKNGKKLFLFDPITTERKPVDYDYLDGLLDIPSNQLSVYICKRKPLYMLGGFLCNEDFTTDDLKGLMAQWNTEETQNEIWKYTDESKKNQVSNLGRARRVNKTTPPTFIIPYLNERSKGLFRIKLHWKGKYREVLLHQVVAELFVINEDGKDHVIHKNNIKIDNRAYNLAYATKKEVCSLGGKSRESIGIIRKELGTGRIIGEYENLLDSQRKTGVAYQNIRECLIGLKPTMGSSTWEYSNEC
jgi:hypothetical protein